MTLETYSLLVSLALVLLLSFSVILVLAYATSAQVRNFLLSIDYYYYIWAIGVLTVGGIIGALAYEYIYHTAVCELCWWQRIFIIPIAITALAAGYWRIVRAEIFIILFIILTSVVALYHYYLHYQAIIREVSVIAPCGGGLLPSCTDSPILVWGFVTIPLMSLTLMVGISVLVYLAFRVRTYKK
ncbi:MAG: disulfide bond formation protein B [Patescibacteria group bacterium]